MAEVRKHSQGNTALEQFVMQALNGAPKKVEPEESVERDYDAPIQHVEQEPTQASGYEQASGWLAIDPSKLIGGN